jgi:5'-deoxynucleotidase YfbR-like HD superfamily hydrolase
MSRPRQGWIQTYTGRKVFPLSPREGDISVEDIAHALANQCRFGGHVSTFYSVAEHSCRVSDLVPAEDQLWGLLHDASEAYLIDLPRPIKHKRALKAYREAEAVLMGVIARKFGLPEKMPSSVKAADTTLLVTEARDLKSPLHPDWLHRSSNGFEPMTEKIIPWSPRRAKAEFKMRFNALMYDRFRGKGL